MDNDWYGQSIETEGVPMISDGTGRPLILREFRFAMRPPPPGVPHPTPQLLFNNHWEHLRTVIRFDGLTANTDIPPRVVIGKKAYKIFILCEPSIRRGIRETVIERPKTLQEVFKKIDKK